MLGASAPPSKQREDAALQAPIFETRNNPLAVRALLCSKPHLCPQQHHWLPKAHLWLGDDAEITAHPSC